MTKFIYVEGGEIHLEFIPLPIRMGKSILIGDNFPNSQD